MMRGLSPAVATSIVAVISFFPSFSNVLSVFRNIFFQPENRFILLGPFCERGYQNLRRIFAHSSRSVGDIGFRYGTLENGYRCRINV